MSIQSGKVWADDLGQGVGHAAGNALGVAGFLEVGRTFAQAGASRLPKPLRGRSRAGDPATWRAGIGGGVMDGITMHCMRRIHDGPLDAVATIASGGTSWTSVMHGSIGSGRLRRKAASGKDKTPD
ncbi:hypothetical protein [Acetobacter nitrogenifigens]|uniref:hypothetical protein n=1 Tax=Acetobacter nitrogenifigens TaxID=285268 RepID=UPI0004263359|nr:hypothetical protein [Acetobacter nitrogenifigens]